MQPQKIQCASNWILFQQLGCEKFSMCVRISLGKFYKRNKKLYLIIAQNKFNSFKHLRILVSQIYFCAFKKLFHKTYHYILEGILCCFSQHF